mgnify:CR=1 FL=1
MAQKNNIKLNINNRLHWFYDKITLLYYGVKYHGWIAVLLIIFCIGVFALLAWFAVTITSEGGVKKIVNSVTNQGSNSGNRDTRINRKFDSSGGFDILDPIDSIYASNIYHHNDWIKRTIRGAFFM